MLLDAYQGEAGLTVLGSKMNRFFLRGALVARLLSQSAWKQYPEHVDVSQVSRGGRGCGYSASHMCRPWWAGSAPSSRCSAVVPVRTNPVTKIGRLMAEHTTEGWSTKFVGAQIGADAMDTWSRGLERFNAARAKYDSAQFYDVDYHDLIADPLGTVADIYRHFGLTLSDEARQAMTTVHAESQSGARAPKHSYSLADYGLTVEMVKERFAGL